MLASAAFAIGSCVAADTVIVLDSSDVDEIADEGARVGKKAAREGKRIAREATDFAEDVADSFKDAYEDAKND